MVAELKERRTKKDIHVGVCKNTLTYEIPNLPLLQRSVAVSIRKENKNGKYRQLEIT